MSINVLIVEDHFETAEILQEYLADNNIHADIATDGKKALEAAGKKTYHCILTDVMLPDVNGLTVANQIHVKNQQVRIIFVTAKQISKTAIKQKLGFDCKIIEKPCKPSEILRVIKQTN